MSSVLKTFEPLLKARGAEGLMEFLKGLDGRLERFSQAQTGFLAQLADYVLTGAGKRVRPALVHITSRFGQANPEHVMRAGLAVEMVHIATLVHDDLVDEAAMRRQKPTVGVKFGDGAAVLLGDFVYAQAFHELALIQNPGLLKLFADTTLVMCGGEIRQWERRYVFDLSEEEYISFLDQKTASLMAAACRAGARLAGLTQVQEDALDVFGRHIGIAFQIIDDILDLEGEEAVTGKTLRTDLAHGKMTLPLIHFRQQISASQQSALFDSLKNPNGQVTELIRQVHAAGSIAYSREKAQALLAQADDALSALPDHPCKDLLRGISSHLSRRKS